MKRKTLVILFSVIASMALAAFAHTHNYGTRPACEMRASDRAWLDRSVIAWRQAAKSYGQFNVPANARVIIGSAECVLISDSALYPDRKIDWLAVDGKGQIPIIEDFTMPVSPVSRAIVVNDKPHFVISAPSVWHKANVPGGKIGLENLMTAVFIHETSHVLQHKSYIEPFVAIVKKTTFLKTSTMTAFKIDLRTPRLSQPR
jgi:hypothetical protein